LRGALKLNGKFNGSDDARQRLKILSLDVGSVADSDRAGVQKMLTDSADDPVALTRLAAMNERTGAIGSAVTEMEAALKENPSNVKTMLTLARLYSLQHETQKALDLAKSAHALAQNDPAVSLSLSELAYQTHDYQWSYSLVQEALGSKADDPRAQYDLAKAAFSIGKVPESEAAMQGALNKGLTGANAEDARRFLGMISLSKNPSSAEADADAAKSALKSDPSYGPALLALAGHQEAIREMPAAVASYETLLQEFPDFAPAKRRLAVLFIDDPSKDQRTSELAVSAQEAFPSDPELVKIQGIVAYRKQNYAMAVGLLQEGAQQRGDDASLMFYLGMSQFQTKDMAAARTSLKRALDLGLNSDLSAKTRETLAAIK
jgi:Flp pilus assembly protein TadD